MALWVIFAIYLESCLLTFFLQATFSIGPVAPDSMTLKKISYLSRLDLGSHQQASNFFNFYDCYDSKCIIGNDASGRRTVSAIYKVTKSFKCFSCFFFNFSDVFTQLRCLFQFVFLVTPFVQHSPFLLRVKIIFLFQRYDKFVLKLFVRVYSIRCRRIASNHSRITSNDSRRMVGAGVENVLESTISFNVVTFASQTTSESELAQDNLVSSSSVVTVEVHKSIQQ